jgi:site-specific recombinase XerD
MRSDLVENSAERSAVDLNAGRDTRALQAYLGHSNIQHTVRYTELSSDRFKGWWKD